MANSKEATARKRTRSFVDYMFAHPEAVEKINRLHKMAFGKDGKSGILGRKVVRRRKPRRP